MLLRVYRITDKFGLILLKLISALGDQLAQGFSVLIGLFSTLLGGIVGVLILLFGSIFALLRRGIMLLFAVLGAIVGLLFALVGRVTNRGARAVKLSADSAISAGSRQITAKGASNQAIAGDGMARKANESVSDVIITEDPLRVQNRRLSYLVAFLGLVVVGAILWATDPNRAPVGQPLAADEGDVPSLLLGERATAQPTEDLISIGGLSTPIPTATQIPAALEVRGTIAFTLRERGQTDLWLVGVGSDNPIRITNDPADERDPQWDPTGQRIAFASRQDGNWELYVYDMQTQATERLTYDLSFQGAPSWSPDGVWLVYESYQGDDLNIYAQRVDGSEAPIAITSESGPDFSPAWSPDPGRQIAFVSWRDGSQDIFIFDLNTNETYNLTNTPGINEDYPVWSPDGRYIAYSAVDGGNENVYVKSVVNPSEPVGVVARGRQPAWAPDGSSIVFANDAQDQSQSYLYAVPFGRAGGVATEVISVPFGATAPSWSQQSIPPRLVNSGGLNLGISDPLFVEQVERSDNPNRAPVGLQTLLDVQTQQPFLSDAVNDSFNALRRRIAEVAGWDFLGQLDDAWWELERLPSPGQEVRNWHKTGRAFALTRNRILGFPPQIEIVREDTDISTNWRVYVRVDDEFQSGELGEPLRRLPWDFTARTSGDIEAYNQGGRLKGQFPTGYYVDFTQIARDFGWERRSAGSDWRANSETIYYWQFIKSEGLDWYQAMLEMYLSSQLGGFNPTPTPQAVAGDS